MQLYALNARLRPQAEVAPSVVTATSGGNEKKIPLRGVLSYVQYVVDLESD